MYIVHTTHTHSNMHIVHTKHNHSNMYTLNNMYIVLTLQTCCIMYIVLTIHTNSSYTLNILTVTDTVPFIRLALCIETSGNSQFVLKMGTS